MRHLQENLRFNPYYANRVTCKRDSITMLATSQTATVPVSSIAASSIAPANLVASSTVLPNLTRDFTETLNCFLLNQIAHQTQRYEQQFEALLNGEQIYEALVSSQKDAVNWADMIDQQSLLRDLKMYDDLAKREKTKSENGWSAAQIAHSHRMALAEPIVERIRLAYLFVHSMNFEQAYKTIEDAADVVVAPAALELEFINDISQAVHLLRDVIKLACDAYCVALLFEECDTNRDGGITRADLENATKRRQCEVPPTVLSFLQQYFYSICQEGSDFTRHAITVDSLNAFMRSNWLCSAFKDLLIS